MKEKQVIVKTEDDLNRPEVRKFMKPLPDDPRQIERMAAFCPKYVEELKPGEIWCLFDTGASCSAMKVAGDCPEYAHLVKPTRGSRIGHGAESACGGTIKERGETVIDMMIDGEYYQLPVRDMDVIMPIS